MFIMGPWNCEEDDLPRWRLGEDDLRRVVGQIRPQAQVSATVDPEMFRVEVPEVGGGMHRRGAGHDAQEWLDVIANARFPMVSADGTDELLVAFFLALATEVPEGYEWAVSDETANLSVELLTASREQIQWVLDGKLSEPMPPSTQQ